MKIRIVSPFPEGFPSGSNVTAYRWARLLASLGHEVAVTDLDHDYAGDILVALGAVPCAPLVLSSYRQAPRRPVIVALTGTDLALLPRHTAAQSAIDLASRVIVFQPAALDSVARTVRQHSEVIYQAAQPLKSAQLPRRDVFVVTLAASLRVEKNPLLAARAARRLPLSSQIRIEHFGAVVDESLAEEVRTEMAGNGRYHWAGAIPHPSLRKRLAASHGLIVPSTVEGGANVISEAAVDGVPILASRIPGNVGILGDQYPGYFTSSDPDSLAELLRLLETSPDFSRRLRAALEPAARNFRPSEEKKRWRRLLAAMAAKIEKPSALAKGLSTS
ncbi:MAG: glycosyltransferase [Bryobacterales bacterium]|nr:glycosyltransferase [Bryobacterales bacterium]